MSKRQVGDTDLSQSSIATSAASSIRTRSDMEWLIRRWKEQASAARSHHHDHRNASGSRGHLKLTARHKYDYRELDRGEAQLIRLGHALWRDRRKLGDTVAEREGIYAALERVWQAKREYRAELARKRASRFSEFRSALAISAKREIPEVEDPTLATKDLKGRRYGQ